ncbi:MAG: hypothetical protein ACYDB7_00615, partial [Mycobacteriales bacterium]
MTRAGHRRARVEWWRRRVPVASYWVLAVLLLLPAWAHLTTRLPGLPGDNKSFLWGLVWVPWALFHGHNPLLSTYVHTPGGINLMWNAWMPPIALLLAPITFTLGPVASYTVLMTSCLALSAWSMSRATARFVSARWLIWGAGLVYEFSPFLLSHALDHPMLVLAVYPPVAVCLASDFFAEQRSAVRTGLYLGLVSAVQLWLDEEILADVAVVATLMLAGWLLSHPRRCRRWIRPLVVASGVAAATFGLLDFYPAFMQFAGPDRIYGSLRPLSTVRGMDLINFLVPNSATGPGLGAAARSFHLDPQEATAYLGLLPLAAIVALWAGWRQMRVRAIAAGAAVAMVLELGPVLRLAGLVLPTPWLPWRTLVLLPVVGDLTPGRFTLEACVLVLLLAAIGLERLGMDLVTRGS